MLLLKNNINASIGVLPVSCNGALTDLEKAVEFLVGCDSLIEFRIGFQPAFKRQFNLASDQLAFIGVNRSRKTAPSHDRCVSNYRHGNFIGFIKRWSSRDLFGHA